MGAGGRPGTLWSVFRCAASSLCAAWRFLGSLLLGEAGSSSLFPLCRHSLFASAFFVEPFSSVRTGYGLIPLSVRAWKTLLPSPRTSPPNCHDRMRRGVGLVVWMRGWVHRWMEGGEGRIGQGCDRECGCGDLPRPSSQFHVHCLRVGQLYLGNAAFSGFFADQAQVSTN